MNQISLYVLLILIFLGLSKSFAPAEKKSIFIPHKEYLSIHYQGSPLSVILLDSFETGFLIKTYYQRYKIFHGFKSPEIVTVRASKDFWMHTKKFQGMSLFRRAEKNSEESFVPMPPGFLYVGDPSFGRFIEKNGTRLWKFHRAYKHYPRVFYWGKFKPSYQFFKTGFLHQRNSTPYFGINNEFGENGNVTKESLIRLINLAGQYKHETIKKSGPDLDGPAIQRLKRKRKRVKKRDLKDHIKQFFSVPHWKISKVNHK